MKRNKSSSARRNKRAKSQSGDKIIDMIKPLADKYFDYLIRIPPETPKKKKQKMIMDKLEEMNEKWLDVCYRKRWDKNKIKPQYRSFADYVIHVNKTRQERIKTNIKVIEHPIRERIVRAFWSVFVKKRFYCLENALKDGMAWKYAYEKACKVKLW